MLDKLQDEMESGDPSGDPVFVDMAMYERMAHCARKFRQARPSGVLKFEVCTACFLHLKPHAITEVCSEPQFILKSLRCSRLYVSSTLVSGTCTPV